MRFFIFLSLFLLSTTVFGHNPNVANFSVRKLSESWVLTAEFSKEKALTSIQKELGDSIDVSALSLLEQKQHIIQYLKNHLEITLNDSVEVILGAGGIKMDGHHIEVILQLGNLPQTVDSYEVFNDAFSDGSNHHNIFVWIDSKFILNQKNNFRIHSIRNKNKIKKRNPIER